MKYRSKIGWWFYLVAFGFAAITVCLFAYGSTLDNQNAKIMLLVLGMMFAVIFFIMIFPVITSTYYVTEKSDLLVRCGLLSSTKIRYENILSIEETRNPMARPRRLLTDWESNTKKAQAPMGKTDIYWCLPN